jgi:heme A synthase
MLLVAKAGPPLRPENVTRSLSMNEHEGAHMVKGRLSGITSGLLGVLGVYAGIVSYLSHPHSGIPLLAMGVLSLLMCLQSFSGASKEARAWIAWALVCVVIAYGLLDIFTGKPEERWAFLIFAGLLFVALIVLFTITHAKGYRWRREDAKTLPPEGG